MMITSRNPIKELYLAMDLVDTSSAEKITGNVKTVLVSSDGMTMEDKDVAFKAMADSCRQEQSRDYFSTQTDLLPTAFLNLPYFSIQSMRALANLCVDHPKNRTILVPAMILLSQSIVSHTRALDGHAKNGNRRHYDTIDTFDRWGIDKSDWLRTAFGVLGNWALEDESHQKTLIENDILRTTLFHIGRIDDELLTTLVTSLVETEAGSNALMQEQTWTIVKALIEGAAKGEARVTIPCAPSVKSISNSTAETQSTLSTSPDSYDQTDADLSTTLVELDSFQIILDALRVISETDKPEHNMMLATALVNPLVTILSPPRTLSSHNKSFAPTTPTSTNPIPSPAVKTATAHLLVSIFTSPSTTSYLITHSVLQTFTSALYRRGSEWEYLVSASALCVGNLCRSDEMSVKLFPGFSRGLVGVLEDARKETGEGEVSVRVRHAVLSCLQNFTVTASHRGVLGELDLLDHCLWALDSDPKLALVAVSTMRLLAKGAQRTMRRIIECASEHSYLAELQYGKDHGVDGRWKEMRRRKKVEKKSSTQNVRMEPSPLTNPIKPTSKSDEEKQDSDQTQLPTPNTTTDDARPTSPTQPAWPLPPLSDTQPPESPMQRLVRYFKYEAVHHAVKCEIARLIVSLVPEIEAVGQDQDADLDLEDTRRDVEACLVFMIKDAGYETLKKEGLIAQKWCQEKWGRLIEVKEEENKVDA